MGYAKFIVLAVGLAGDKSFTIMFGLAYGLLCPVVGYFWIRLKYADMENEINNRLNPFQKEVRRNLLKSISHR